MKKFLSITLLLTLTLSVLQSGLKVHYCGDELTGIDFFNGLIHSEDCDCADEGEESCCADLVIKAPQLPQLVFQKPLQQIKVYQFCTLLFTSVRTEINQENRGNTNSLTLHGQLGYAPQQRCLVSLGVFRI